ncbi:MAG: NADP-reducing hydrogenase subunit HndA [Dehalococcoidia bacterium]|nr:NADP-reducing hydrogenase subunit HndA [Chloroflexota bacterium]MBT9162515.1 NADP-reducing hydrogenase subunit HndA [Chloroflexota bacterium]
MEELEEEHLLEILSHYDGRKWELIPILLEVQTNLAYLPKDAIQLIADFFGITEGQIYSVASFYTQFRLLPLGRNRVTVCRGTACHIRGAPQIFGETAKALGLKEGETSSNLEYTLETVACIGCCALAPCMRINQQVHGEMTAEKVRELFPAPCEGEQDAQ